MTRAIDRSAPARDDSVIGEASGGLAEELEDTEMGTTWTARLPFVTAGPKVVRAADEHVAPRVAGTGARWFDRLRKREAGVSTRGASAPARLDWTSSTARHFPPR